MSSSFIRDSTKKFERRFPTVRMPTDPQVDKKVFVHSATRTKAVNLGQTVKRGGIRF